ncbi:protein phosphatase 1E-like [Lineus longissimus]|uniref:protein phosphatase 1E-like n=1 Tax=Lineus longissimus TaxID=88925 RepID=UPI00315CDA45
MEEISSNNIPLFKQFLAKFHDDTYGSLTEDDTFPFRLVTYYISPSDAEGECIDWILQYLAHQNKCPPVLALNIARAVVNEFKTIDLIELYRANQSLEEEKEDYVPQIEANKFALAVFHKVHKVCSLWHNDLPKICLPDVCYEVSSHGIKNSRRKMEDRHMVIPDLNSLFDLKDYPNQSYYAVFDGHGGLDAAWYSAAHVHTNLVRQPMFRDDPLTALRNAFLKTDEDFDIKAKNEGLRSGSTAVAILLRDKKLYLSWLGDSQAILVKDGVPVSIMSPHKPEREDEKHRVEALGGCVIWFGAWRVNGALSVSRAIGDTDHKPYISSEPDTFSCELDGTEDYIVIACDGLWDSILPKNLTGLVYNHIQENGGDRSRIANKLISEAREEGSNDNISVVVVFLRENIGVPASMESQDEQLMSGDSENGGTNETEQADGSVDMGSADLSPGASPGGMPDDPGPPSGDPGAQDTEDREGVNLGKAESKSSPVNNQKASPVPSPRQQKNKPKTSLTIDVGSKNKEIGPRGRKSSGTNDVRSSIGIIGQKSPLSPRDKSNQFPSVKEKGSSPGVKSPTALKDRTSDMNSGKFYPSPVAASMKQKKSSCETILDGANVTSSGSNTAAAKQISTKMFATMPASVGSQRSPVIPGSNRKVSQSTSLK